MKDYYSLLHNIYEQGELVGPRGKLTKELLGKTLIVKGYNLFANEKYRPMEDVWKYLLGELSWYLSGERDVKKILPYSKFWESIRNPDGTANSNYGDLVFYRKNSKGISSFAWALERLQGDAETRKAIVLYNDRELFYPDNKDLICNQYQHFLIRNHELICYVGLRSSDAIYGLQFNIPWWSLVQQQMFLSLKPLYPTLQLGRIEAFISSAHIYENKFELVNNILSSKNRTYFLHVNSIIPLRKTFEWYQEHLCEYISIEEVGEIDMRKNKLK